jgi:hypothetical protein
MGLARGLFFAAVLGPAYPFLWLLWLTVRVTWFTVSRYTLIAGFEDRL